MFNFDPTIKSDRLLNAALTCFKQYGFKRTSMDDIAKAANMSRPALYLLFKNKTDIFHSLAQRFHEVTLSAAREILSGGSDIQSKLTQALIIRKLPLYALAHDSVHGPELLDVTLSTAADINTEANAQFITVFENAIAVAMQRGTITTSTTSASELAKILYASAYGLKESADTPEQYETLLRKMVQTVFDGIASK